MIKIGYTHYWKLAENIGPSQMAGATELMKQIIEHTDVPIAGLHGEGEPRISSESCWFNGKTPDDYETFAFGEVGFHFCKTRGDKPYDEVVCACLLAAKYELDNLIEVNSDGNAADWEEGRILFKAATGFEPPAGVPEND